VLTRSNIQTKIGLDVELPNLVKALPLHNLVHSLKTLYCAALVTFSLFAARIATADDIADIVARAKQSVAEVHATDADGHERLGTGWFYIGKLLVTNFHVVAGANAHAITVTTGTGQVLHTKEWVVWAFDPDIAMLALDIPGDRKLPSLGFLQHSTAREGDRVLVIGNPDGLYGTVSDGIVSAFRDGGNMIQITAPISAGSSGSPVLDQNGTVIGVATAFDTKGQNLNFAISSDAVWHLFDSQLGPYSRDYEQGLDNTPAKQMDLNIVTAEIHNARLRLAKALSPEQSTLFKEDRDMWEGFFESPNNRSMTDYNGMRRRVDVLLELCQKYEKRD
jgi:S1-C subfamily serine protease